jgi:hypothetical protein
VSACHKAATYTGQQKHRGKKTRIYRVAVIYSHFKFTQNTGRTRYRELVCFTCKHDSSSVHLSVSAICSSQNAQMPCVLQHPGCYRSNCVVDPYTKFNHISNFWTECRVLYTAPKEEIQRDYIGGAGRTRDWFVPTNPFGKLLCSLSQCKFPVWRDTISLKENVWLKVCHLQDCK